ncbi:MAG TPA: permease-like cell division protein FtsX [Thiobacillaceae bacterium]|nr:permease-like cell division protein FtsX [Thiobacillaceae bacterium]
MNLLRAQLTALKAALSRFWHSPLVSLFTLVAIGVAISLPASLYLVLANLDRLAGHLPTQPEISLYVSRDASQDQAKQLGQVLSGRKDLSKARFVSRDTALKNLVETGGLNDITAGLDGNPLPDAWVLTPADPDPAALEKLRAELEKLPGVAEVNLDSQWAARLQAALRIGRTLVGLFSGLFALALMAISGNAIRSQILARRDEIEVSRLIGASDRYIRRSFLYHGTLQGLLGGLMALLILLVLVAALQGPVAGLATLYASPFRLGFLELSEQGLILLLAALSGWLGAWLAVSRTLRQVDPN